MNEYEIFLSKLADCDELLSEVSKKLGVEGDFSEYLDSIVSPVSIKIYISNENINNRELKQIVDIFKKSGFENENISLEIREEEFLNLIKDYKITKQYKPRSLVHRDGDLHTTVHIWIIKRMDMGIYALLQKRSLCKETYPGCYDVSSAGHVTQGQELIESAVRELSEELGLEVPPEKLSFIGIKEKNLTYNGINDNEICAVYLYQQNVDIESLTLQKEEVSDAAWAEIDEILSVMDRKDFKHCINKDELFMIKKAVL